MQKILSLVWFKIYPPHFGGQKGIALFNKYLAAHFSVDCLCSRDNDIVPDAGCTILPQLGVGKKALLNPRNWVRLRQQLARNRYAYLIVEFPYYGLPALLLKGRRTKLIVHTHNIESLRFKSLHKPAWRLLYQYEKVLYRKAHLVLFKTESERARARQLFHLPMHKTYVVPYGIERAAPFNKAVAQHTVRQRHGLRADEKILLFAGTLDYGPNADAVTEIYQELEPRLRGLLPHFKILICGRNRFPEFSYLKSYQNENCIYAGEVPDIETYFAAADVFINPVQNVHGVQTKIFDALNYNLNVVSFAVAMNGLPLYFYEKVLTAAANDFDGFAQQVVAALHAPFDTPERFYEDFGWHGVLKKFAFFLKNQPASA